MKVDLIDRKILYYLDMNARQNISSLAKKLRIGRNVALYRIKKLKENNIIKGSFAEINNSALNYKSFRIFFKLGNYTDNKKKEFYEHITKNENILWFSQVLGKWDLDIVFMSKEISDFEKFRRKLFLKFNSIIEDYNISLLTKIFHYPKDYLIGNTRNNIIPTILDIEQKSDHNIDKKDEEILKILSKDAMVNIVDIALKSKMSINTVKKKIKNLEKSNIILGYRLFLNLNSIGYQHYKLHISLKNYNEKNIKDLRIWLVSNPFVIYTDHYINGEDFEIELHLKNENEYLDFWNKLSNQFGKIIKDHFMITFHDVKVFKYIPAKF